MFKVKNKRNRALRIFNARVFSTIAGSVFVLFFGMVSEPQAKSSEGIWLLDTRPASPTQPNERQFERLSVHHLKQRETPLSTARTKSTQFWANSSLDEFFDDYDPETPCVIFVHGNHFTREDAVRSGLQLERNMLQGEKCRFIIWAWPSEWMSRGIRRDAQIKARYSEHQGAYLSMLLLRFPKDARVTLIGYSFGGRTVCDSMQRLAQKSETSGESPHCRLRNVLLLPAVNQSSLHPKAAYGNAFDVPEKTLLLFNPRDRALKWYPFLQHCHGPQALGRVGIQPGRVSRNLAEKVRAIDISPFVGDRHEFSFHVSNPKLLVREKDFILFRTE